MLLLEPGGHAQAGGSRSRSVPSDCETARRSCARFCSLRRTKFSRNALASLASRAARSILFLGAIRGGSLIPRWNENAANLSRVQLLLACLVRITACRCRLSGGAPSQHPPSLY